MAKTTGLLLVLPPRICENGIEMVLAQTSTVPYIVYHLLHGLSRSWKANSWAADTPVSMQRYGSVAGSGNDIEAKGFGKGKEEGGATWQHVATVATSGLAIPVADKAMFKRSSS